MFFSHAPLYYNNEAIPKRVARATTYFILFIFFFFSNSPARLIDSTDVSPGRESINRPYRIPLDRSLFCVCIWDSLLYYASRVEDKSRQKNV